MSAADPFEIRHEADRRRFVADLPGGAAFITYRQVEGRRLDLDHTYVPPALRGGGIASRLTAHALEYARQHRFRVVPSCPFVAAYLERHPQFRELLA